MNEDELEPIKQRWEEIYHATDTSGEEDENSPDYEGITSPDDVDFCDFLHGFLRGQGVPEHQAFEISMQAPDNGWLI